MSDPPKNETEVTSTDESSDSPDREPSSAPPADKAPAPAKKKPRAASLPTPLDSFATVESSWGYPSFARNFPRHPDLDRMVAAFAEGDYGAVREGAAKILAGDGDDRLKRAAETLHIRMRPDPTTKILFAFAAGLLAFLTIWWVAHDGPAHDEKPAKSVPTVEHVD